MANPLDPRSRNVLSPQAIMAGLLRRPANALGNYGMAVNEQARVDAARPGTVGVTGGLLAAQPQGAGGTGRYLGESVLRFGSVVPGLGGDILGVISDLQMMRKRPETRTLANAGLFALGVLPAVPPLLSMMNRNVDAPKNALAAATRSQLGATGSRRRVYHATESAFNDYDITKAGSRSKHASSEVPGVWFTASPEVASMHVANRTWDKTPIAKYGPRGAGVQAIGYADFPTGANIRPAKLKLKNPKTISASDGQKLIFGSGDWREGGTEFQDIVKRAQDAGHDGIVIKGNPRARALEFRADQYLVFDPAAIKSAYEPGR